MCDENIQVLIFNQGKKSNLSSIYFLKNKLRNIEVGKLVKIEAKNCDFYNGYGCKNIYFEQLVAILVKISKNYFDIIEIDKVRRSIYIKKKNVNKNFSWQAGIIYSGRIDELTVLGECVQSLKNQPELSGDNNSIIVCGPPIQESKHIEDFYKVKYLPFEENASSRFLIGAKKNYLLNFMSSGKRLILHSRIKLKPACIKNMPKNFDLITPRVEVIDDEGNQLPYLDLCFTTMGSFFGHATKIQLPINYKREEWLTYMDKYYPYIDGGVFAISKECFEDCKIDEHLAWGEGEDIDWCMRQLSCGNLVELSVNSYAISSTCKTPTYLKFGKLKFYNKIRNWIRSFQFMIQ